MVEVEGRIDVQPDDPECERNILLSVIHVNVTMKPTSPPDSSALLGGVLTLVSSCRLELKDSSSLAEI